MMVLEVAPTVSTLIEIRPKCEGHAAMHYVANTTSQGLDSKMKTTLG